MPEEETGGSRNRGNSLAGNKNWGARGPGPGMRQNMGIHWQNDEERGIHAGDGD